MIENEFFYSKKLGLYVAYRPLIIDERVLQAAQKLKINLSWDDKGRVNNISFYNAKNLLSALGSEMLTPEGYWKLYFEAKQLKDDCLLEELTSSFYTEWLNCLFLKKEDDTIYSWRNPDLEKVREIESLGVRVKMPTGRPGWFSPDSTIIKSGLPFKINQNLDPEIKAPWKYWSVFKINEVVASIRGYVISSGTPSLDLDIPPDSRQPVLMIRECRKSLLAPEIDQEILNEAIIILKNYDKTIAKKPAIKNQRLLDIFYETRFNVLEFINKNGEELFGAKSKKGLMVKEGLIDAIGLLRILAITKQDLGFEKKLLKLRLFKSTELSYNDLSKFIQSRKKELRKAIQKKQKIIFVMGHKNPDTDTAVSSIFEAFRNQILDKSVAYVPIIQSERVPDEIKRLLGSFSNKLIMANNGIYKKAAHSGLARWILTDQNVSEVQRFVNSIIDHHILSEKAKQISTPITWEMTGSATVLVVQKMLGLGMSFDQKIGKILLGAALMDTENRGTKKMTSKDKLIMDYLKSIGKVENEKIFFQDLMSYLLNTNDAKRLFRRDYKQDWGIFGFSVVKVKGVFDKEGTVLKKKLLSELVRLAEENNKNKNFALTIIKIVNYEKDNETVSRERIYLIFNESAQGAFKKTMFKFIRKIITKEFGEKVKITEHKNAIDFWGTGEQLSRKVTAPYFEPIVNAYNEYFYSPSLKIYIKRDFLKNNQAVKLAAKKFSLIYKVDSQNRVNNINFKDAKLLSEALKFNILSLREYWIARKDILKAKDEQLISHFHSKDFVEFLDTVIFDGKEIIEHPRVSRVNSMKYTGKKLKVKILEGVPGLIDPKNIDVKTGFPKKINNPRNYDKKHLWRYWSPDRSICIPTRGHIFLLNQTSFDNKIHPEDVFPNLGIRPCLKRLTPPKVKFIETSNDVKAIIE